jgi:hypothetical protein
MELITKPRLTKITMGPGPISEEQMRSISITSITHFTESIYEKRMIESTHKINVIRMKVVRKKKITTSKQWTIEKNPGPVDNCFNCRKPGHKISDCKAPLFCINCGNYGHMLKGCDFIMFPFDKERVNQFKICRRKNLPIIPRTPEIVHAAAVQDNINIIIPPKVESEIVVPELIKPVIIPSVFNPLTKTRGKYEDLPVGQELSADDFEFSYNKKYYSTYPIINSKTINFILYFILYSIFIYYFLPFRTVILATVIYVVTTNYRLRDVFLLVTVINVLALVLARGYLIDIYSFFIDLYIIFMTILGHFIFLHFLFIFVDSIDETSFTRKREKFYTHHFEMFGREEFEGESDLRADSHGHGPVVHNEPAMANVMFTLTRPHKMKWKQPDYFGQFCKWLVGAPQVHKERMLLVSIEVLTQFLASEKIVLKDLFEDNEARILRCMKNISTVNYNRGEVFNKHQDVLGNTALVAVHYVMYRSEHLQCLTIARPLNH